MKRTKLAVVGLLALCALAFGSEAFARGGGSGQGARLRDGSCVTNQTGTVSGSQSMQGQRLQGSSAMTGTAGQGAGQGKMRRLGPGDGTGNTVPPANGTGSGTPATP